ncbi:hypothetical protein ACWD5Z_30420 [Micromonospora chokoriensis]
MSDFLDQIARVGGGLWDWVGDTNPDTWAAGAGWTTVVIAFVASIAAFRQVREARTLREEQAQPYVVAFMEASQTSEHIIEFVVRNFGTTIARNVRMECTPALRRTSSRGEESEEVKVFDVLPVLVPGQEWRIFWDNGITRKDALLSDRYEVTLRYEDSHHKAMSPTQAILDWGFYKSRMWVETFGQHHAAKALREISSLIKKSTDFGGGLSVFVRDGDAKDERRRAEAAEMHAKLERLNARVLSRGSEGDADDDLAPAEAEADNEEAARPSPADGNAAHEGVEHRRSAVADGAGQ